MCNMTNNQNIIDFPFRSNTIIMPRTGVYNFLSLVKPLLILVFALKCQMTQFKRLYFWICKTGNEVRNNCCLDNEEIQQYLI